MKQVLLFVLLFCIFSSFPLFAADFRSEYEIEYYIKEESPSQQYVKASYVLRIVNLQPDLYISKFSLFFPQSFGVGDIKAYDDSGPITSFISENEKTRSVEVALPLNKPKIGMNEVNMLYVDLLQKNVFKAKGAVWEILIPTMENADMSLKSVTVYLPLGKHRKLSLAKPKPTNITFDKVVWEKPNVKAIYAIFGDVQNYQTSLRYTLTNPRVQKVYTDIAFPPDTLYQQIFVQQIEPPPDKIYSDSDGNFMARYYLNPRETKQIYFNGYVQISVYPRENYSEYAKSQFTVQKNTLFDNQSFWQLDSKTPIQTEKIKDIYDFVMNTLSYNFSRIIKDNSRLGAKQALLYPDQAVCTEYSDVFVALARKNGFFVREIQGFGFANEQEIRPVSEYSDILHSWIEYFDLSKQIWIPIDPTWNDTSGIDYFSSFDLNHIVFAIHGKKADYPYPAGSYKIDKTAKDISINAVAEIPISTQPQIKAEIAPLFLPSTNKNEFIVTAQIKNRGKTSILSKKIFIQIQNASTNSTHILLDYLLPGESREITIPVYPNKALFIQNVPISLIFEDKVLTEKVLSLPTILSNIQTFISLPVLFIVLGLYKYFF